MPHSLDDLLAIMARLRDPEHGCPWDVRQDFASLAPYAVEEAYEVVDAIERQDWPGLREELGDLLLQVVFHAQLAGEAGWFDFAEVVDGLAAKLLRRHPHVFAGVRYADADEQARAWAAIKAAERALHGIPEDASALGGIGTGLSPWRRAQALQRKAAAVGFEWKTLEPLWAKLEEERDELREAIETDAGAPRIEEELGDLLFVVANLARLTGVDMERALRGANAKFERRFRHMETQAGRALSELAPAELAALWNAAKQADHPA